MKKARGGSTLRASKSRGGFEVLPANRLGLEVYCMPQACPTASVADQAARSSASVPLNILARFRKQIMPFSLAMMPSEKDLSKEAEISGTG